MRGLNDNGMRWLAARVMIAAEDVKRFGGMSVQDLKLALKHIPGSEGLTVNYAPKTGDMRVTIAGRTVEVRPAASNAEIAAAFANPTVPTANTTVTTLPPAPRLVPITQVSTPKMSITGAANATMTIKDLIASSRSTVKAAHEKLIANVGKVQDAAAALDGLGDDLGSEAADLMSMIGQFKNDLSPSTPAAPTATPLPAAAPIAPAPASVPV
jgi:hypothetical protein